PASVPKGGPWRSASPSPRCATSAPIRRPGASCSTATIRATSATRCSAASCRAARTASSATRPSWSVSPGCRSRTPSGALGGPLDDRSDDWDGGLDAKWTPNADTAIDATINPDFSQIESDVAQISANERFALFYPEKRPFFLEELDLFSTPIQAVYTRTITSPRWGLRSTGQVGSTV